MQGRYCCSAGHAYDPAVPIDAPRVPPDIVSERSVAGLVVVAALVSAVTGVVLAAVYRPNEFGWLRSVHAGAAAVAVISAIAARVVGTGGRLRVSGRRALLLVVLIVVLGGAFATGSSLAWKGGSPDDRGMFLSAGHEVQVGGSSVGGGSLVAGFVLHTVLGVCSFVLLAGRYVRSWWRLRSTRSSA